MAAKRQDETEAESDQPFCSSRWTASKQKDEMTENESTKCDEWFSQAHLAWAVHGVWAVGKTVPANPCKVTVGVW